MRHTHTRTRTRKKKSFFFCLCVSVFFLREILRGGKFFFFTSGDETHKKIIIIIKKKDWKLIDIIRERGIFFFLWHLGSSRGGGGGERRWARIFQFRECERFDSARQLISTIQTKWISLADEWERENEFLNFSILLPNRRWKERKNKKKNREGKCHHHNNQTVSGFGSFQNFIGRERETHWRGHVPRG